MRLLKKLFILIVILIFPIYFLLATNLGLYTVARGITYFLPGKLTIEKLQGQLISHFKIKNLSYQSANQSISLDSLTVTWSAKKLLMSKVVIEKTDIQHLHIFLTENKNKNLNTNTTKAKTKINSSTNYIDSFKWLNAFEIKQVNVKDLTVYSNKKNIVDIQEMNIHHQHDSHFISLISKQVTIKGNYQLQWHSGLEWETQLDISNINLNRENTNINFSLLSKGAWSHQNNLISLVIKNINGKISHYPITGLADFTYRNGEIKIEKTNLTIDKAYVSLSGLIGSNWNIDWNVFIPNINVLIPNSNGKIISSGNILGKTKTLNITAKLQGEKISIEELKINSLTAAINSKFNSQTGFASLKANQLDYSGYKIPKLNLDIQSVKTKNDLISQINLSLSQENKMHGKVVITNFNNLGRENSIQGNLKVNFKQLKHLFVIPEISELQGNLQGEIALSGKLNQPLVAIQAEINQGQFIIPKLKAPFKQIYLKANYKSTQPIYFDGNFIAGNGKGIVSGSFDPEQTGLPVEIKLQGENLLVSNLPEYKITASPHLSIQYKNDQTQINGNVFINSARISPKDLSQLTTLPEETVIVGKTTSHYETPQSLILQTQVVLSDHIFISYANLKSQLKGKLFISKKLGQPLTGSGLLYVVNGNYHAYGKSLHVDKGRLIFAGNVLTDPGLDIQASKQFDAVAFAKDQSQFAADHNTSSVYQGNEKITAGIMIKGTLKKPSLSFFSNPSGLNQHDILSYLVFGYPQSQIKDMGNLAILNNIASSFNANNNAGLSQVNKIKNSVKNMLGLSDISLATVQTFNPEENKSITNNAVKLEKKLGKNISIQYRVGVFNSVSVLNLKYKINKLFSIQSETSSQDNGADLLFEYEHD